MDPEQRISAIEDAIRTLADVICQVVDKLNEVDGKIDAMNLEEMKADLGGVKEELGSMVGGLNGIIDTRRKAEFSGQFAQEHPEFSRYATIKGKPTKDRFGFDPLELATDKAWEYGQAPDATEEGKNALISSMLEELRTKFDDLVDAINDEEATEGKEAPAPGGAVVIEKQEVKPGNDSLPEIMNAARKLRGAKLS